MTIARFRKIIWEYYKKCGRDLPWRNTRDPYRILVSEVMLQQTQVSRALAYYPRFIRAFPNFKALHQAPLRRALLLWQGLGYNRRALALKRIAAEVVERYGGRLPRAPEELEKLPGIGHATAAAVAAFSRNTPVLFLETNIRSVVLHFFFPRRKKVDDRELLPILGRALDRANPREWYWALMDYGSYLKTTHRNPGRRSGGHRRQPPFAGSLRELRGAIIRELLAKGRATPETLARRLRTSKIRAAAAVKGLLSDGLATWRGNAILIHNGQKSAA